MGKIKGCIPTGNTAGLSCLTKNSRLDATSVDFRQWENAWNYARKHRRNFCYFANFKPGFFAV
jgi:hypothetical protein